MHVLTLSFYRLLKNAAGNLRTEQGQVNELIGQQDRMQDRMLTFLTRVRELISCTQPYS